MRPAYHMRGMLCATTKLLLCAGLLSAVGCAADWHGSHEQYSKPFEAGDLVTASTEATRIAKDATPHDKVLLDLEAGAVLRAAGKLKESNAEFACANKLVGDYKQWPNVKISEEALAAISTVRTINYRGSVADLVMMNTYEAMNYIELGKPDDARVTLVRAGFVQDTIAHQYAAELQKAQDDLESQKTAGDGSYDANRTMAQKDDQGRTIEQRLTQDESKDLLNLRPYAAYVNPFCDYMQGIFFYGAGEDHSDWERAATAFKRVASMAPDNPYISQDVIAADRVANGDGLTPTTYVIFETGLAPEIGQVQIPLPLFILNNQAPTVVLYFPTIHARDGYVRSLDVNAGGTTYKTSVVSDMDSVLMLQFKHELPAVITRMIIGAATKAAADAATRQALKGQNPYAQLGVGLAMAVYQVAMNQADLRAWGTLPREFQVARFATPADHQLVLSAPGAGGNVTVTLGDGTINLVFVKSIRTGLPLIVRHCQLQSGAVVSHLASAGSQHEPMSSLSK